LHQRVGQRGPDLCGASLHPCAWWPIRMRAGGPRFTPPSASLALSACVFSHSSCACRRPAFRPSIVKFELRRLCPLFGPHCPSSSAAWRAVVRISAAEQSRMMAKLSIRTPCECPLTSSLQALADVHRHAVLAVLDPLAE